MTAPAPSQARERISCHQNLIASCHQNPDSRHQKKNSCFRQDEIFLAMISFFKNRFEQQTDNAKLYLVCLEVGLLIQAHAVKIHFSPILIPR